MKAPKIDLLPSGRAWLPPRNPGECAHAHGAARGFSLIEIAIALGILAFALIPVLGLMPIGLTTLRDTVDTTVSARIAQTVVNQAQQADYNSLPVTGGTTYYFDEQGDLIPNSTGALSTGALYKASLQIGEPTAIPSGNLGITSMDLATLTITVQLMSTKASRTLSALVARATH